jgi:hypothetical protein
MKQLVKFHYSYADEFYCQEFKIFNSENEYNEWINTIKTHIENSSVEFYFGTNEYHEFNSMNKFLNCITSTAISNTESDIISNLIGPKFGTGGMFDVEPFEDYEDDEDDSYIYEE